MSLEETELVYKTKRILASFLTYYINGMYYVGFCPFKLVLENRSCEKGNHPDFTVKRWLPQNILFVLSTTLLLLTALGPLRSIDIPNAKTPPECCLILIFLATLFRIMQYTYDFLLHSQRSAKIVNFILNCQDFQLDMPNLKHAYKIQIFALLVVVGSLINSVVTFFVGQTTFFTKPNSGVSEGFWNSAVTYGWRTFAFRNWEGSLNQNLTRADTIIGSVGIAARFHSYVS